MQYLKLVYIKHALITLCQIEASFNTQWPKYGARVLKPHWNKAAHDLKFYSRRTSFDTIVAVLCLTSSKNNAARKPKSFNKRFLSRCGDK